METPEHAHAVGQEALIRLIDDFRNHRIRNNRNHKQRLEQHLRQLTDRWNQRYSGYPRIAVPTSSFTGVCLTSVRDRLLKKIIIRLLEAEQRDQPNITIVNPACVFGRHARHLARRLAPCQVIGTDINPTFNRLYERAILGRSPPNFRFQTDDIFHPTLKTTPTAVVFFGACGSVSDGAIDYGVVSNAPHLIFRTCCPDNIGGNTQIVKRSTPLNWLFRLKNAVLARKKERDTGEYFSDQYSIERYPRSRAARALSDAKEFLEVSRNSVDSDICRSIINLDRYLYLAENGYDVWFQGDLFVARKRHERSDS